MRLGWNEIKGRAKIFSDAHADKTDERADSQLFLEDFFKIFGMSSRQIGRYERRVANVSLKQRGFIDFFWPGQLIIEMKSRGKNLVAAEKQALDYIDGVHPTERPRYVLTCDFQTWNLLDLETGRATKFVLAELHKHIESFGFILGRRVSFGTLPAVNINAAELMGKLHDALEDSFYTGHDLEQLLVRLLFCLFADYTGIFEPRNVFLQLIEADTKEDGSDTGRMLIELFDVLNTGEAERQKGLSGELNAFPYVNGALFSGHIKTPVFDKKTREMLLDAARFDWGKVSPAIFGSLFQSVMSPKERRAKGAHYTTEANILKVIGPLFLDELKAEFAKIMARKTGRDPLLREFQHKLSRLTFMDPACGCGNFLVIAYRELRSLELAVLHELWAKKLDGQRVMDIAAFSLVNVDQFYGIEFEEFPARIAEVAMWMTDHIANNELSLAFGQSFARIPLKQSAKIIHGDALEVDWADLLPPEKCYYIMGNPPFVGKKEQSPTQKIQVRRIFEGATGSGELDYVSCWFEKASAYAGGNARIRIAFVSTNSICQGEQVATLWSRILLHHRMEIEFAHRTFEWNSEARGGAHVHVIIVGFAKTGMDRSRRIFEYERQKGEPIEIIARNINPYLVDGPNTFVTKIRDPISSRPKIQKGSEATDFGHLTISKSERSEFLEADGFQRRWLKEFIGGDEFINDSKRYCLWLVDASPSDLRNCPIVLERIRRVTDARKGSDKARTKLWAAYPALFSENRQPSQRYLLVPKVSSQRRDYVPMGFVEPEIIVSGSAQFVETADSFVFGVLTSAIHMVWMRAVGGRTKSDYQYTNTLVYNTFPWPDPTTAQRAKIETLARAVLDARTAHQPMSSLADLYDPDTMPGNLRKAHAVLDTAVDRLYRPTPFASDRDRVEHLFGRYEALVNPLERVGIAKNKRVAKKAEMS